MDIRSIIEQVQREETAKKEMQLTLWDVGHGLSIWIKTPNGHNHWIDAGWYPETDFCPAHHVRHHYGETSLDYLIISHPDSDHLHNLPKIIEHLGEPRVLSRNKSVPRDQKFGAGTLDYQKAYKDLDTRYNSQTPEERSPGNPAYNGGITVKTGHLDFSKAPSLNDSSVVAFYAFAGWLFVMPGDIGPTGWKALWEEYSETFQPLISQAKYKILVAPHHGRTSGYSKEMMDTLSPDMVLISDKYGKEPTDERFRNNPNGLHWQSEDRKFLSTKTGGRIQFTVKGDGSCNLNQQ